MKAISILTKILATFVMLGCFTQNAFSANAMHIVINNHLGAPEMLIDENRHVVWQAEYDEFGKATILVEEVEFNHRLPGQYYDKETGLHYNYYRDYDPSLGRYVQSDPIGLAGGINTYGYVGGNPVNYTDSKGLLLDQQALNTAMQTATQAATEGSSMLGRVCGPVGVLITGLFPTKIGDGTCDNNQCPDDSDDTDDDDFCYTRWAYEDAACSAWASLGARVVSACKSRASNRRNLCYSNGGKPNPLEPPEYNPFQDMPR